VTAPAMSHLICTMGLVVLIFLMPVFYSIVANNVRVDMQRRELKEIADYVSNTLENLYFLVNSTEYSSVSIEKELIYLPPNVENSVFILAIVGSGGQAQRVSAYLKSTPSVVSDAWFPAGLKIGDENSLESGSSRIPVAGCSRNASGVYVSIWYR